MNRLGKYAGINPISEKLHDGEPYFLIRAQDMLSLQALAAYSIALDKVGLTDQAREVRAISVAFAEWQGENAEMVKLPD
jgi:hypothetical protein